MAARTSGPTRLVFSDTVSDPQLHRPSSPQRRGRVLVALAGVLLVLVCLMEGLLIRSFQEVRSRTADFTDAGHAITDLANVHREALALARDVEQMAPDDYATVRLRANLLANQWRLYRIDIDTAGQFGSRVADIAGPMAQVLADITRVDELVAAEGYTPAVVNLRGQLRQLEESLKREYDSQEVTYLASLSAALDSRADSKLQLLVVSGGVLALAALTLTLARRSARRELRETEQRLAASEASYDSLVEQVAEAVVRLDASGRLLCCNRAWSVLTGASALRSNGRLLLEFVDDEDRAVLGQALAVAATGRAIPFPLRLRIVDRPGGFRWALVDVVPGPGSEALVTLADITEQVKTQAALDRISMTDPLTGLSNRVELDAHLARTLARARRSGQLGAVLCLDLDHFKLVNDGLGHDVGDTVLREIASRVMRCLRASDVAARLGGDEFVIVCDSLPRDRVAATEEAALVAARICEAVAQGVAIDGREIFVTTSIGVAVVLPGQGPEQLLSDSEVAMHRAKERGRARVEVFDEAMRLEVARKTSIEQDLHRCVERNELEMWLQPIYALDDGHLVRFEALLRWRHPRLGLLLPGSFVGVAEEMGHIERLGTWVLWEATATASRWAPGPDGVVPGISVNVSGRQLVQGQLADEVEAAVAACRLPPGRLCLEVGEGTYVGADPRVRASLEQIRAGGVELAIDNFGTGPSSLASLRSMPVDIVKLDRGFVAGLSSSVEDHAIIRSIIQLGASLGFAITAEGVETGSQARRLRELGCSQAQGFLLGRPVPRIAAVAITRAGRIDLDAMVGGAHAESLRDGAQHGDIVGQR